MKPFNKRINNSMFRKANDKTTFTKCEPATSSEKKNKYGNISQNNKTSVAHNLGSLNNFTKHKEKNM